ncbi:MAG: hypothetical protein R2784_13725 [Saprospiraceae bacterium]
MLQEFDYDSAVLLLSILKGIFFKNLEIGLDTIQYKYSKTFPSNTGLNSGIDIDENGKIANPGMHMDLVFLMDNMDLQCFRDILLILTPFEHFKISNGKICLERFYPKKKMENLYSQEALRFSDFRQKTMLTCL